MEGLAAEEEAPVLGRRGRTKTEGRKLTSHRGNREERREDYSKPSPREGAKRKGEEEGNDERWRAGWRGGYAIVSWCARSSTNSERAQRAGERERERERERKGGREGGRFLFRVFLPLPPSLSLSLSLSLSFSLSPPLSFHSRRRMASRSRILDSSFSSCSLRLPPSPTFARRRNGATGGGTRFFLMANKPGGARWRTARDCRINWL